MERNGWPKACRCGETWSRAEWGELPPIGRYRAEEWLEIRSCVCGATLAVPAREVDDSGAHASGSTP